MSQLNTEQRAAVTQISGPMLVLAGAGSGKTRVITEKIAYLIRGRHFRPTQICAVTFTNKAAREMRARIAALGTEQTGDGPFISTFHQLGLRILRTEYHRLGYRRGFSIFDAADSLSQVKEILKQDGHAMNGAAEAAAARISAWKSALVGPDEAAQKAADPLELQAARVYARYVESLKAYNGLDFDDLITAPVTLLRDDAEVRAQWQARLGYLLVDEYQDTNGAQYEMMRQLVGAEPNFTVVGDDDQSIYAWRGAQPENLVQLKQDYPDLAVVKLEQNYRSSGRILSAANRLIANNPHVFEKRLWSALGPGAAIRVWSAADATDEAQRVVGEILHARRAKATEWGEFAILYRGNHQARPFEEALRTQQIPYHLSGGLSFFDRAEVKDTLAYLRLVANPDDDTAFLRIVNTPRREIGAASLKALAEYAGKRQSSLLTASLEFGLASHLAERSARRLHKFARWIVETADLAERGDPVKVTRELVDAAGYRGWLEENARDPAAAERCWDNVCELFSWLSRMALNRPDATLGDLISQLSILDNVDRDDEDRSKMVSLMTLHAAKGLEFDQVFLVGMEENLLPHHACQEGAALDEERRLAYVGITRARRRLTVTHARSRKRFGETLDCVPSRFLEELPQDEVEWEKRDGNVSADERRQRGRAAIADLRSLLGEG